MALTLSTSYEQDQPDLSTGVVEDTTSNYGTGGNQARGDAANVLLWCKTDSDGNRVFDNPAIGDVYSIMTWTVNNSVSGWYERMLMRIQNYDNGASYVEQQSSGGVITQYASIVYYASTNKFYKCRAASTGNIPTNTSFWTEITDLSTIIDNTNIEIEITDTYVNGQAAECVSDKFTAIAGCGCDNKENKQAYYLNGLMIAADSAVLQGNYNEMERFIREVESLCLC